MEIDAFSQHVTRVRGKVNSVPAGDTPDPPATLSAASHAFADAALALHSWRDALGADQRARFAQHLLERKLLHAPFASDIALAYFAATGYRAAQTELFALTVATARRVLPKRGASADLIDDAVGEVAAALLAGDGAMLRGYQGHAPLGGWLKTIVIRTAQHLQELARRTAMCDNAEPLLARLTESMSGAGTASRTAGLAHQALANHALAAPLRRALFDAVQALSLFDRALLAEAFVRGVGIEALAAKHGVHRGTLARWLSRAREQFVQAMRAQLATSVVRSDSEISSAIRAVSESMAGELMRLLTAAT